MNRKLDLPFRSFTREGLQNLLMLALAIFYIAQYSTDLAWKNMCGQLAIDYCSFWTAAKIANEQGYANVYDLNKMEEIQRTIFPKRYIVDGVFATVPTPYLPAFILPFQILNFLGPYQGYWLWSAINLLILFLYLRFFTKSMTDLQLSSRVFIMFLLSLPVFLNLYYGQVNLLLAICVGEYMRATMTGKSLRAGLWLGGLLLKPQYLILIGLILLIQRSIKILVGFAVSSAAILGISLLLAGTKGVLSLIQLWFGYTSGLPATGPEVMMNWRMVGLNLSPYFGISIGWAITLAGTAITFLATLYIWRHPINPNSPVYAIALLGTFAATGVLAWHSHISSAMILIPMLIYLSQSPKQLPDKILSAWIYIPPLFRFAVFVLAILIQTDILNDNLTNLLNLLLGVSEFGLNLYLLGWALIHFRSPAYLNL